jgi:hypothetical protein
MDPDSRSNLDPNRWSTNKRVKARITEFLGAPVVRADGPKTVRPDKKTMRPQEPNVDPLLNGLLTIQRNRDAAASKLAKRGYRTQTEHEIMKSRWPFKPLV